MNHQERCTNIEYFSELIDGRYQKRCPNVADYELQDEVGDRYDCCKSHAIGFLSAHEDARVTEVLNPEEIAFDSPRYLASGSPIEQAFWEAWHSRFRNHIQGGLPLIPQYKIGKYRVDFAQIKTKTVIELDGYATHSSPDAIAYDRQRQRYIESQGWHVIRFGGKEIYSDAQACANEAWYWICARHSQQNPIRIWKEVGV